MSVERRTWLVGSLAAAVLAACGAPPAEPPAAPPPSPTGPVVEPGSNFHAVYDDPASKDRFFLFLQNVFHLFPEAAFHDLVAANTARYRTDQEIYEALLAGLPAIRPTGAIVSLALPALEKQKEEMAFQASSLLGPGARFDGYLELGTTGRYFRTLKQQVEVQGPVFVVNDQKPANTPADLVERGQLAPVGTFVPLGDYDPLPDVPDASVDLVSDLIGLHHCPEARLPDFLATLRRLLRPGGRLLLREHDVVDPAMSTFVALAHDVFNAGVGLSWADNAAQIRGFRSVADWRRLLGEHGFAEGQQARLQTGDPTDNAMLLFTRA